MTDIPADKPAPELPTDVKAAMASLETELNEVVTAMYRLVAGKSAILAVAAAGGLLAFIAHGISGVPRDKVFAMAVDMARETSIGLDSLAFPGKAEA